MSSAARLAAQGLAGPPLKSAAAVAERLLAVQAQDARGARLAIRARTSGLTARDVDAALESGELVVSWLNRGTLHLVRAEDHPWLLALTAPRHERAALRRLAQEGVRDPERAVARVCRALEDEGPLPRAALGERLGLAGQGLVHVLYLTCLRGLAVRGGGEAYVRLPPLPPVDRDRALAELGRRYLRGHAPADERDLARWAGIPLRDARRALANQVTVTSVARATEVTVTSVAPRLLGPYEPVLLGWASREWIAGSERVVSGGVFRAFALVDGRAVATWRADMTLEPFEALAPEVERALQAEAADVRRFLGR